MVNKLDFTADFLDSISTEAAVSVPEAFDAAFGQLAPHIKKRYSLFEAPRPQPSATRVLVVFGPGAGSIARAAAKRGVHVIVVRVYRPWSPKHFVAALPVAVRQLVRGQRWTIGVATLCSRASVLDALAGDVVSTLTSSPDWNGPAPEVVKFAVTPNAHGVTAGMAAEVAETLLSATTSAAITVSPNNSNTHKLSTAEAGCVQTHFARPNPSPSLDRISDCPVSPLLAYQVLDLGMGNTRRRCIGC